MTLLRGKQPLFAVREAISPSVRPPRPAWAVADGALVFRPQERSRRDEFVVRREPLDAEAARDAWYDAEIEISAGDVAGIVLRASPMGAPCYAVLLGAESNTVRLASLPWPGRDLLSVAHPIENNRRYRLAVHCRRGQNENATQFSVLLDGKKVFDYADQTTPATAGGTHVGVLVNNASARFHELAAWPATPAGQKGAPPLFRDDFARPDRLADYRVGDGAGADNVTPGLPLRAVIEPAGNLVTFSARMPLRGRGMGAQAQIRHLMDNPRHVWVPHLAPVPGFVIGDHALRAPALIFSDNKRVLVLVPDIEDVEAARRQGLRVWLDYDHPQRTVTVAVGNYRPEGFHVGYRAVPVEYAGQQVRLRVHVLASDRPDDVANPYGVAARWLWATWGRPRHEQGGSQRAPLARYAEYVKRWAFGPGGWEDTVWQEFSLGGQQVGAPAFIVDVAQHPSVPREKRRWREQKSVWNQAWFSTQRCANGLLRYARQTGDADLEKRARAMTQVALLAPQTDGLFPSVFTAGGGGYALDKDTPDWSAGRWTNGDRRPPGASEKAVHILDAAFTARLLLEWHDLVGPGETEAVPYVRRFADRLCRLQRPSGAFPGWVEPNGATPAALAEGPESAMGATLLLELAARFPGETRYREAAVRALRYLAGGPVAQGRWEDFETYFSCSRWGSDDQIGKLVARNGVYKSNTLSLFWCAEAFLAAHQTLGDQKENRWLALGRRCLDELSLYQQVWDPSWIPAPCHGGFGVMNADGEWNDARQSLFAPLYLDYYRATGQAEYFERGVAALRASFALLYCPENALVRGAYERAHPFFGPESYGFTMENIAHGGPDGNTIGPFTIFSWGNGAALSATALVRARFGDVYVDAARNTAFGIDGCEATITNGAVQIRDRYHRAALVVRYAGSGASRTVPLGGGRGTALRNAASP